MKYIEKVILENFQSHKYTVMEFNNQLNVIVGPSDSGKTAILRGIRWALYNEPSGDYFIREGENECSVTIVFNDKTKIKRFRNKSKNAYILYDSDNNESKFEGFGTSVPQEIIDKTGIKKIPLDKDLSTAINISDQLEGAFLLSERGSTRANSIGILVGVNIIDDALRETLKDNRTLSTNQKIIDDNIVKLKDELLEYDYLEALKGKVDSVQIIRDQIIYKTNILSKYKLLHEKSLSVFLEKQEVKYYIDKLRGTKLLEDKLKDISVGINKLNYYEKKHILIKKLSIDIYEDTNIINRLRDINRADKIVAESNIRYNSILQFTEFKSKLEHYSKEINDLSKLTDKLISLNLVSKNIKIIDSMILNLSKFNVLNDKLISLQKSIVIGDKYIEKLKNIYIISNIQTHLQQNILFINRLQDLCKLYKQNQQETRISINLIEEYNGILEKKLVSYKDILLKQGTCPFCFNNIDDDKITHILSHYM
ncbi:AAA family ATPase [Tissierella sp.]|uniref:AAA family ATPase n=1 Tax=Tissierella sp. TaxID=41274 RepID=UPI0028569F39|nr:AAA family ATPase [Tissierella sp.]MDR7856209.1 AAA family ATPase [Tissierella sp.]